MPRRGERTLTVLSGMVKFSPMLNNAARASYFANWIQNSLRQKDLWPEGEVPALPLPAGAVRVNSSNLATPARIPLDGPMPKGNTSVGLEIVVVKTAAWKRRSMLRAWLRWAKAAVRVALQWKFPPRIEEGRAVEVRCRSTMASRGHHTRPRRNFTRYTRRLWSFDCQRCSGRNNRWAPRAAASIDASLIAAQLVRRVEPVYPAAARDSGVKGTVRFRATLGPDGAVTSLQLVSGHPMLVNAARTAVAQWLYTRGSQTERRWMSAPQLMWK
jgi:TonB family protein